MGTRSITVVKDVHGNDIIAMYKQYDGYMEGWGASLSGYLKGKSLVNGFSSGDSLDTAFHGPECMAAAIVSHFKTGIGDIYLHPPGVYNIGEEYRYTVFVRDGAINITVEAVRRDMYTILFDGSALELYEYVKELALREHMVDTAGQGA